MTPREKAKQLVEKFIPYCTHDEYGLVTPVAKYCALVAVDEMIMELDGVWADVAADSARSCWVTIKHRENMQKIKEEIIKM